LVEGEATYVAPSPALPLAGERRMRSECIFSISYGTTRYSWWSRKWSTTPSSGDSLMRKWFRAVGFVLMLLPTVVEAQQGSLEGKWYGVIKEYHFGEPRRNLTISFAGSTPICIWQEIGKAVDRTSCSIQSNTIRLTTSFGSAVQLAPNHDSLDGTFTLKDGQKFVLSMGREQIDDAKLESLFPGTAPAKACRGIISLVVRGYYSYGRTALWMELKPNSVTVWYRVGLAADDGTTVPTSKDGMTLLSRAIPLKSDGDRLSFVNPFTHAQYTLRPKGSDYQVDMKNDGGLWAGNLSCQ